MLTKLKNWLKDRLNSELSDICDHSWQDIDVKVQWGDDDLFMANAGKVQQCMKCGNRRMKPILSTSTTADMNDITIRAY